MFGPRPPPYFTIFSLVDHRICALCHSARAVMVAYGYRRFGHWCVCEALLLGGLQLIWRSSVLMRLLLRYLAARAYRGGGSVMGRFLWGPTTAPLLFFEVGINSHCFAPLHSAPKEGRRHPHPCPPRNLRRRYCFHAGGFYGTCALFLFCFVCMYDARDNPPPAPPHPLGSGSSHAVCPEVPNPPLGR